MCLLAEGILDGLGRLELCFLSDPFPCNTLMFMLLVFAVLLSLKFVFCWNIVRHWE